MIVGQHNRQARGIGMMMLCIGVFFGQYAVAQQVTSVVDDGEVLAVISKREITRISLASDRIAKIVKGDLPFTITHDPDQGDVYFRPELVDITRPVNFFLNSEKGFTYKVILVPEDVPAAHIILHNEEAVALGQETELLLEAPAHEAIVSLVRAMATGTLLDGFTIAATADSSSLAQLLPDASVVVKSHWQGSIYRGEEIALSMKPSATAETIDLAPSMFAALPHVAGIWIETPTVEKTAVASLFIVYRLGD